MDNLFYINYIKRGFERTIKEFVKEYKNVDNMRKDKENIITYLSDFLSVKLFENFSDYCSINLYYNIQEKRLKRVSHCIDNKQSEYETLFLFQVYANDTAFVNQKNYKMNLIVFKKKNFEDNIDFKKIDIKDWDIVKIIDVNLDLKEIKFLNFSFNKLNEKNVYNEKLYKLYERLSDVIFFNKNNEQKSLF